MHVIRRGGLIAMTGLLLVCFTEARTVAQTITSPQPSPKATIQAKPAVVRLEVEVLAIPQVVCRTTSYSAALECKPTGDSSCPTEILFQRGVNAPLQSCQATCAPQTTSGARCDCTFVPEQCRTLPRAGRS